MALNRETAAAENWNRTLSRIPTVLGRLAYLASLRNANTGAYEHVGLSQRIGETESNDLLRRSHMAVFQEWLCLGLPNQKSEVEEYFSGLEGDAREMVTNWVTLPPYPDWVPSESRDVERKLFCTDLGAVVEALRNDYGVASRDPDS